MLEESKNPIKSKLIFLKCVRMLPNFFHLEVHWSNSSYPASVEHRRISGNGEKVFSIPHPSRKKNLHHPSLLWPIIAEVECPFRLDQPFPEGGCFLVYRVPKK